MMKRSNGTALRSLDSNELSAAQGAGGGGGTCSSGPASGAAAAAGATTQTTCTGAGAGSIAYTDPTTGKVITVKQ